MQEYEYFAFISYKREDERWAQWIQRKLERYRVPVALQRSVQGLPDSIRPIFRDKTDLAGGFLGEEINTALQNSRFLVVVCSPSAAQSEWVSKEVEAFINMGRKEYIIPFIISGSPFAADDEEECFPKALRELEGDSEILGISVPESGKNRALIKLIACLLGVKFDAIWSRYHRGKMIRTIGVSVVFLLLILLLGAWGISLYRNDLYNTMMHSNHYAVKAWQSFYDRNTPKTIEYALRGLPDNIHSHNAYVNPDIIELLNRIEEINPGLKPVLILPAGTDAVVSSKSDRYFVQKDSVVSVYELSTRRLIGEIRGNKCEFSPDGHYLIVKGLDSSRVYKAKDLTPYFMFKGQETYGKSPYENAWICDYAGKTVFINPDNGEIVRTLEGLPALTRKGKVLGKDLASRLYSPKGRFFFSELGNKLILHDTQTWNIVLEKEREVNFNAHDCFAVTENDDYLVYRDESRDKMWRVSLNTPSKSEYFLSDAGPAVDDYYGDLMCVISRPTGIPSSEAANEKSRILKVIDIVSGKTICTFEHEDHIAFAGFLNHGKYILSYCRKKAENHDRIVSLWNVTTGEMITSCNVETRSFGLPTDGDIMEDGSFAFLSYGTRLSMAICVRIKDNILHPYKLAGSRLKYCWPPSDIIGIDAGTYNIFYAVQSKNNYQGYHFSHNNMYLYSSNAILDVPSLDTVATSLKPIKELHESGKYYRTEDGIFSLPQGAKIYDGYAEFLPYDIFARDYHNRLYDLPSMICVDSSVIALQFYSQSTLVASASKDGRANIYDYFSGKRTESFDFQGYPYSFSKRCDKLLTTIEKSYSDLRGDAFTIYYSDGETPKDYHIQRRYSSNTWYAEDLVSSDGWSIELSDGTDSGGDKSILSSLDGFFLFVDNKKGTMVVDLNDGHPTILHPLGRIRDIAVSNDGTHFMTLESVDIVKYIEIFDRGGRLIHRFSNVWETSLSNKALTPSAETTYTIPDYDKGNVVIDLENFDVLSNSVIPSDQDLITTWSKFSSEQDSLIVSRFYDQLDWSHKIGIKDGEIRRVLTTEELIDHYKAVLGDLSFSED